MSFKQLQGTGHGTQSQSALTSLVVTPKKYSMHQLELTDAVIEFVAENLLPLSIVDSPYFYTLE